MYKDDNSDYLPESYPVNNPDVWVQGDMTVAAQAGNADLIRQGKLYNYNQSVAIYHCPADQGVVINGTVTPTVRSYSMNCFMGARDPSVGVIPPPPAPTSLSILRIPTSRDPRNCGCWWTRMSAVSMTASSLPTRRRRSGSTSQPTPRTAITIASPLTSLTAIPRSGVIGTRAAARSPGIRPSNPATWIWPNWQARP